jgi:chromosome segregation ATPase
MDDEPDNTGIGSLAAFQLGRWSAQESQWIEDWKTSRRYPVVAKEHYDYAVQMNQALVAENQQVHAQNQQLRAQTAALQQSVQDWERDYEKLRATAQGHLDNYWALMSERDNLEARVLNLRDELRELRGEE